MSTLAMIVTDWTGWPIEVSREDMGFLLSSCLTCWASVSSTSLDVVVSNVRGGGEMRANPSGVDGIPDLKL